MFLTFLLMRIKDIYTRYFFTQVISLTEDKTTPPSMQEQEIGQRIWCVMFLKFVDISTLKKSEPDDDLFCWTWHLMDTFDCIKEK